jgi:DNA primase
MKKSKYRYSREYVSGFWICKDYFHKTLLKSEEGKNIGLSYFKEGFTNETIEKFSLGYSQILGMLSPKRRLGKAIN